VIPVEAAQTGTRNKRSLEPIAARGHVVPAGGKPQGQQRSPL